MNIVCDERIVEVEVNSTMLPLGTEIPPFELPDFDGRIMSSSDSAGAPTMLVMFICNHCPYIRHVRPALAQLAGEYRDRGCFPCTGVTPRH